MHHTFHPIIYRDEISSLGMKQEPQLCPLFSKINGNAAVKEAGADSHHDVPFDYLVFTPISLGVNR